MTHRDEIARLRSRIDAADDALVDALAGRTRAVRALWAIKDAQGDDRFDPAREAEVVERLVQRAVDAGLRADAVRQVLSAVVGRDLSA